MLGNSRRGEIDWSNALVGVIVAGFVIFNLGRIQSCLIGYQSKVVPAITAEEIKSLYSSRPAVIYFYHKPTDSTPQRYLPILDTFASKFGDRVDFYRYKLKDYHNEELKNYWQYESQLVVFVKGREVRSAPAILADALMVKGFIFKLLKPWIMTAHAPLVQREQWYVTGPDFEQKVLGASKPVVVNFTCKTCPAAQHFEPHFKKAALENHRLADFYLVDTDDPQNRDILKKYGAFATPTTILFFNGEKRVKQRGSSMQADANEAFVLGMISDYYY